MMDAETIQILLDLLNPLHGSIDKQIMDQITDERELDAPSDREYNVDVTVRMERDLTQAVAILENRLRDPPSPVKGQDATEVLAAFKVFADLARAYESFDDQHTYADDFIAYGKRAGEHLSELDGKKWLGEITVGDLRAARWAFGVLAAPAPPQAAETVNAVERSRVREIVLKTCRNRSYRICETILAEVDKLPILDATRVIADHRTTENS